jgi:putative tryptophan/tyrosine transport system substrate-binding protein
MRRRDFIGLLGWVAAAWPLAARAQQAGRMPRIGFLGLTSPSVHRVRLDVFREGMRELGYIEGQTVTIEYRWAEGRYDRLPALAAELARLRVDLIVTHGTPGGFAAKEASTTIPVVVASAGEMVETGLVASLARPGGNVTGTTFFFPEIMGKRLQLLKEIRPETSRVAVLLNPDTPAHRPAFETMAAPAESLAVKLQPIHVRRPLDLEPAFVQMTEARADALVIPEDGMIGANVVRIVELAGKNRIPAIGGSLVTDAGGLISYATEPFDRYRRAAFLVDKILKGANPAELPVEQPTKFELIVNLRTAQALGISIPRRLLARADKVIE